MRTARGGVQFKYSPNVPGQESIQRIAETVRLLTILSLSRFLAACYKVLINGAVLLLGGA